MNDENTLRPETLAITSGRPKKIVDGSINSSISLSSTFHAGGPVGYGRYGNETWTDLEDAIATLEGGPTLAFSSGMAAISAVFSILPVGAVVTASNQGYSGVMSLLHILDASGKIELRSVDVSITEEVLAALPGTALLWLESPTNPTLTVADLPRLISAAKTFGSGVAVDNTFATPLVQKPLDMGADIVAHSVTKYLAGHSDVILGSLTLKIPPSIPGLKRRERSVARSLGLLKPGWPCAASALSPFVLKGRRQIPLKLHRGFRAIPKWITSTTPDWVATDFTNALQVLCTDLVQCSHSLSTLE